MNFKTSFSIPKCFLLEEWSQHIQSSQSSWYFGLRICLTGRVSGLCEGKCLPGCSFLSLSPGVCFSTSLRLGSNFSAFRKSTWSAAKLGNIALSAARGARFQGCGRGDGTHIHFILPRFCEVIDLWEFSYGMSNIARATTQPGLKTNQALC